MATVTSSLTAAPAAPPWYQVIPPFRWITAPRQPKRLRPAGHAAWVEAMHQPVLLLISVAFMFAGLYTLGKDYFIKGAAAIGGGDYAQIIPVGLALVVIVVTGLAIEIAFLTAASRLRMHLLRKEWGWMWVSALMLTFTLGVEGLTCSYMFYLIEAPKIGGGFATFMALVPSLLFFVRAYAGLICAAFLIIGVLPFVIRPDDVRREMAAEAGAAKVAIVQRLLHVINDLSVWQMLAIYEPVAAIFRDNAGYTSTQGANRMALAALGDVKQQLTTNGHMKPEIAAIFAPIEDAHRTNAGMELERYDEQTHAALTRLQERLTSANKVEGAMYEATGNLAVQLAQAQTALKTEVQDTVGALRDEVLQAIFAMQQQIADGISEQEEEQEAPIQLTQRTAKQSAPAAAKPGTLAFQQAVRRVGNQLLSEQQSVTIFAIAQLLQSDPQAVQQAVDAMKQHRLGRLAPGKELRPDPVLDRLV